MKPITFQSNSEALTGNLFIADQPMPLAFLFLQGWRGHQNLKGAQNLVKLGISGMTYDMRGNGDSEGDFSILSAAEYLADAIIAYDFFKTKLGNNTKIGVIGNSFGSYIGTLLTTERPVECLSLKVPANYPDEKFASLVLPQVDTQELAQWRNQKRPYQNNKATQALHDFAGAIQIVEADQDQVVPHQTVQNYLDAIANKEQLEYKVLKDAPHNLIDERLQEAYGQFLSDWVQKQIPGLL